MIFIFLVVIGILILVVAYGQFRWKSETKKIRARLCKAMVHRDLLPYRENQIAGLPAPVQRYLKNVLNDDQQIATFRPGFDWDARIFMIPGIFVNVHDAYIEGEGILHAAIFGLVSMTNFHGAGETARGELMRFFAETVWYPTALLPSQGAKSEAECVCRCKVKSLG